MLYDDTLFVGHGVLFTLALLFHAFTDLKSFISKDIITMIIAQNVLPKNRYMKTDSTVLVHLDALL